MTIASLNVNNLLGHINEIQMLLSKLGIHILALNKVKIDETIDCLVDVKGYRIKMCDRCHNGCGVAVYLKDTLVDK